jgi:hypothetical protein
MWKRNFMFRSAEAIPLAESENELFHDTDPAMDSTGLRLEKFLSVWIQGDGDGDTPTAFTNMYVRTATLDFRKRVGFSPDQTIAHTGPKTVSATVARQFGSPGLGGHGRSFQDIV